MSRNGAGEEPADHISPLHDDILIQVLSRLGCAAAAARTTALSRRWRDGALWRHLSELSFRGLAHGALEAALAQVTLPRLSLLDIEVTDRVPAEAVASLLRAAARLDPVEVSVVVAWVIRNEDEPAAVEVPSFPRATSITLRLRDLRRTLPAAQGGAGEEFQCFPVLERLSITSGRFDTGALISRCPKLRVPELIYCWGIETVKIHSATMEELLVTSELLLGVDVAAPMLKKFILRSGVHFHFGMSLLAPAVENLSWKCWCHGKSIAPAMAVAVGITTLWRLVRLELGADWSGFVLGLDIARSSV
nr:unnamed protein product [Digitaria exilis]